MKNVKSFFRARLLPADPENLEKINKPDTTDSHQRLSMQCTLDISNKSVLRPIRIIANFVRINANFVRNTERALYCSSNLLGADSTSSTSDLFL